MSTFKLNHTPKEIRKMVLDHLEAHPESHAQDIWLEVPNDWRRLLAIDSIEANACNTAGCLAGWAAILDRQVIGWDASAKNWAIFNAEGRLDEDWVTFGQEALEMHWSVLVSSNSEKALDALRTMVEADNQEVNDAV